jgi:DNA-binding transcriptional MocR family regulator
MLVQYALRNYMRGEHLSRYVRQVREWCNKKSEMLAGELAKQFGNKVVIQNNGIGLYIGLRVLNGMSSRELVDSAESKGVTVMPIDVYYQSPKLPPKSTILLNFGGVRYGDIPKAVKRLYEAWFES